jgi:hypothetical protein
LGGLIGGILGGGGSVQANCFLPGSCPSLRVPSILDLLPQMPGPGCDFGPCSNDPSGIGNGLLSTADPNVPSPRLNSVADCAEDAWSTMGTPGKVIRFFSVFSYSSELNNGAINNIKETGIFGSLKAAGLWLSSKAAPVVGGIAKAGAEVTVTGVTIGSSVMDGVILGGCAVGVVKNAINNMPTPTNPIPGR